LREGYYNIFVISRISFDRMHYHTVCPKPQQLVSLFFLGWKDEAILRLR
jgi:hypothetical protein